MATLSINLDVTQYVQVNVALNPMTLESHRDVVRITLSEDKPAKTNTVFHMLGGDSEPLAFSSIDTNVWALATSANCKLIVTETDSIKVVTDTGASMLELIISTNYDMIGKLGDVVTELKIMNMYNAMAHNETILKEDVDNA